jgi:hypothetical protein
MSDHDKKWISKGYSIIQFLRFLCCHQGICELGYKGVSRTHWNSQYLPKYIQLCSMSDHDKQMDFTKGIQYHSQGFYAVIKALVNSAMKGVYHSHRICPSLIQLCGISDP